MRICHKTTGIIGHSGEFNVHSVDEIIVSFEDGERTTCSMSDYDVGLPDGWKDLRQAFQDRDVIPNNYNTGFAFPINDEARQRGYNP